MTHKFTFNGGSSSKSTIPLSFKIKLLSLCRDGSTAKAAMTTLAKEFDITLKPSYFTHAGSHKFRFVKEIGKKIVNGDKEAIALCEEYKVEINITEVA